MSIVSRIRQLKEEQKAIILAHNYQLSEVQDIADFVGDSLGLSIKASQTQAKVIVFCGVYFMAETAKIVCPQKKVLIPEPESGCPMADMITASQLRALKDKHPQARILCYVNTPAEVKALSDVCCTSANATQIAQRAFIEDEQIIFVPDKYLAHYTFTQIRRNFIFWDGYCPAHVKITPQDILAQKELHPGAKVLVHPECTPQVIALADQVLSTEGMARFVNNSQDKEFIIATEPGIIHRLKKDNPSKEFFPACEDAICQNMKRITLEKVLWSLEYSQHEIKLEPHIIKEAQRSIQRMLAYRG